MTVPIYTSYLAPQVEYILKDSLAKVAVVSDAVELQKVLDVRDRCPDLKHVIVLDTVPWSQGRAMPFETIVQKGLAALAADPDAWEERASSLLPTDLATMIYTSGTTGEPKGAILTHGNVVANVAACSTLFDVTADMVALSFLPLSHVFERMVDYLYFSRATTIAYAESIDKLSENFGEVKPHCFAAVPRVYEKMRARVQSAGARSSPGASRRARCTSGRSKPARSRPSSSGSSTGSRTGWSSRRSRRGSAAGSASRSRAGRRSPTTSRRSSGPRASRSTRGTDSRRRARSSPATARESGASGRLGARFPG
jgi:long-subunit acyl-CoA synthetase (AMP-forming)